jgi:hypothetical protein
MLDRLASSLTLLLCLAGCGSVATAHTDAGAVKADARSGSDAGSPDAGGCRKDTDCPMASDGQLCIGPVAPFAIAACEDTPSCTEDSSCDGGVCETAAVTGGPDQCNGGGSSFCQSPCQTSTDCNYWTECNTNGHCVPLACDKCPSYLSCSGGQCAPKSCGSDADCKGGFCVDDTCMGTLGTCAGPFG